MKKLSMISLTLLILAGCSTPVTPQPMTPAVPPQQFTGMPTTTTVFTTPLPTAVTTPLQPEAEITTTPDIFPHVPTKPYDMYLIALEDAGQSGAEVGCGDSAVPVTVDVPEGEPSPVRYVVEHMLAMKEPYFGESGLYNVFYESNLVVDDYQVEGGQAVLRLSGQLMLRGVCDDPRVQAQLEQTLLQEPGVDSVQIYLNGAPLADALSEK